MDDNSNRRMINVFFYGLYMDPDLLGDRGVQPRDPRRASVADYSLRIGTQATLLRCTGAHAWGVVYALTHDEVDVLYGALPTYRAEPVLARTVNGQFVPALCYILFDPPQPGEANPDYAAALTAAAQRLGLPIDHIPRRSEPLASTQGMSSDREQSR
ncbi:gamma-glutamylcyclotransferase family protein [Kribbella sp. CA-253562]|uniref:gamma-glutamylcyclotransferase family protein n=1 Tax=Kribbella sp. CA-253562 TaxID=3239942 RepID=UPI003D8E52CE